MYYDHDGTEETGSTGSSTPPTPSADRVYAPITGSWPSLQSQTTKEVLQSVLKVRKSWKTLRGGETVWPLDLEAALLEGLENYQPDDSRETRMLGRFPRRNRFISDYIFEKTGKRRSAKQVGSRLQQLRESCGGQKLMHLLSPFRKSASSYCESSASSDSPCNSPVSPVPGENSFPRASCSRRTVICIDILPDGSTDDPSKPSWSDNGDVLHASDRPRPLDTIDPTVTFMSPTPISAQSRFTVCVNGLVVHTESAPLLPVMNSSSRVSGFLYSTTLVPEYWKTISECPDPTRFTIQQEVVKDEPSSTIFYATYKFSFPLRHPNGVPPPLDTLHTPNTHSEMDSVLSAASMQHAHSQLRGDRYPLYAGSTQWVNSPTLSSRENSPTLGYHSPTSSSESSTCFPSDLSNYVL